MHVPEYSIALHHTFLKLEIWKSDRGASPRALTVFTIVFHPMNTYYSCSIYTESEQSSPYQDPMNHYTQHLLFTII